jgi:hypothetical protein
MAPQARPSGSNQAKAEMESFPDATETAALADRVAPSKVYFSRSRGLLFVGISLALLVPCFWHPRIEAGDLASHVYNTWLAQLIEKGQVPGLYIARQWNNILVDISLNFLARMVGLAAAQVIIVALCVLIFFWGVFALVSTVTGRRPWLLTPGIAMLAYGYSFNMGFFNYYLSLGLACFSLVFFWRARSIRWLAGAMLLPLVTLAHPIGLLWLVGSLFHIKLRSTLRGWRKLTVPVAAVGGLLTIHWYLVRRARFPVDWGQGQFYFLNGVDQLVLFGPRYVVLAWAVLIFAAFCVALDGFARRREASGGKLFTLPLELYVVTFLATWLLPENLRPSIDAGWIGLLVSRLTTISAVFGLCILGCLKARKWHLAGFSACAVFFFTFLYQDTQWLNRLESNAERLVRDLPLGTRVIATIWAPPGSRVTFIGHVVDRACIGHCFSYANYEAPSRQFRVRSRAGSNVVTSSTDDSADMEAGEYDVQDEDPPLKQIYQCDETDLTKLCARDLVPGEKNGRIGYHPPKD